MKKLIFLSLILISSFLANAQSNVIDQVIAIVGNQEVLKSDVENEFLRYQSMGMASGSQDFKAQIFEEILIQKLLLSQAKRDSISVTESQVESQLNSRIDQYILRIGSKEKLEKYYKKSVMEIKDDFRNDIRNMMITEQMKNTITKDIRTTPSEVRRYYRTLNQDSLPDLPSKLEIQMIARKPVVSLTEKQRIREKLRVFRDRINNGESFATIAVLYSDDKGSATRGGELGYTARAKLVPEFANVAFNLKTDKISKIVETEYGFHIIQLIDRKGERINVRHILLTAKIDIQEKQDAINKLDTLANQIRNGEIDFAKAAQFVSEDKETKNNGGLLVNPQTGSSKLSIDILSKQSPATAEQVKKLKVGEISEPFIDESMGKLAIKIIKLSKIYASHKANLNDDWTQFENMLVAEKQKKIFDKWVMDNISSTYIHIDASYLNSKFNHKGWIK
jgi:peptidyl-prolyl cis-trans isomerase SurA